ncbi:MAG TPA: type II toxin-antitoxin system RelE/ParE family toxin [Flavobacteriaceae bacterium]|nr:type II toxin-antitoxin system RelE/ParE family toxin [Flavobacteriaceae bacterium]
MSSEKKRFYKLSLDAALDMEEIFDYSIEEFGAKQAHDYASKMHTLFLKLTEQPEIGRKRNEIKIGLRSLPIGEHIVFYRILNDKIRILRILHGSRDIPNYF